jgi:hypothetical protein
MQVFGNSPDETAYCRLILNKETVAEALTAIQPTLMAHTLHSAVSPVLLDVSSIEVGTAESLRFKSLSDVFSHRCCRF